MGVFPLTPKGERFGRIGKYQPNIQYFRSIPPWGLGGKRKNRFLVKKLIFK